MFFSCSLKKALVYDNDGSVRRCLFSVTGHLELNDVFIPNAVFTKLSR